MSPNGTDFSLCLDATRLARLARPLLRFNAKENGTAGTNVHAVPVQPKRALYQFRSGLNWGTVAFVARMSRSKSAFCAISICSCLVSDIAPPAKGRHRSSGLRRSSIHPDTEAVLDHFLELVEALKAALR